MAADIRSLIEESARRYGVPVRIAQNLAMAESSMNPKAVSPAGAIGVMQLMPSTARSLGVDPYDPAQNIEGGIRYLKQQYDRFGSWPLAVAAYNSGPSTVQKYGGIPPYRETQGHVSKVMSGVPGAAAPTATTTTPVAQTPQERLQKLLQITRSPYTSNWMKAMASAQDFVAAHRAPSLWAQVPAGTKTLSREQMEETARHARSLEDIARGELGETSRHHKASEDIERLRTLAALSGGGGATGEAKDPTPATAAERAFDAENKAFEKMMQGYNDAMSPLDAREQFVKKTPEYSYNAVTNIIQRSLTNPNLMKALTSTGGDWYNTLNSFTIATLSMPLENYAKKYRETAGEADPLAVLLDSVIAQHYGITVSDYHADLKMNTNP